MTLSEKIACISLAVSFLALLASCYPHIIDHKKRKRQSVERIKKIILSSAWSNEGWGDVSPKNYINLQFFNEGNGNNIYATLGEDIELNTIYIRGKINHKGEINATLATSFGWREFPAANVFLKYNEDEDKIDYKFKHYLPRTISEANLKRYDYTTKLSRVAKYDV